MGRQSWRIDSGSSKYLAIRQAHLRPNEKPIEPAVARRIIERFVLRPGSASQLLALAHAAGTRSTFGADLRAIFSAFDRGALVLLNRADRLPAFQSAEAASIPDIVRTAREVKTWIEFEVVDENGKPCAGVRYVCMMPDGRLDEGYLDSRGIARFQDIDPGNCTFTLPELDASAWAAV